MHRASKGAPSKAAKHRIHGSVPAIQRDNKNVKTLEKLIKRVQWYRRVITQL